MTTHRFPIAPDHTDSLSTEIYAAEGRSTARTVSAREVIRAASAAESWLDQLGVPNRSRVGFELEITGSTKLPASYGAGAQATFVRLKRIGAGWRLVDVRRDWNRPTALHRATLPFSNAELGEWARAARFRNP